MEYTYNAPAKINIGLDVIRKREDGYHDLKMIMQTLNLFDTLTFTVEQCDTKAAGTVTMTCSNDTLPLDDNNLVVAAIRLLMKEYDISANISVHLEKRIPVAAGMAGGSSDAAASLIAMNDIFSLGLSKDELMKYGVRLGADIPYCIMQGTALSEGIGDILTPLTPLRDVYILIAKPPVNVSTGFVYGNLKITEETVHPDIDGIIDAMKANDAAKVSTLMSNVLETVTAPAYPVIRDLENIMMNNGALGSIMSGSGPTVFGIFENEACAKKAGEQCENAVKEVFCSVTTCYNP